MAERTSHPHGTFSWVEVATPRQEEAKAFLSELFGWEFDDMPVDESTVYSMGKIGDRYVGAVSPQQQDEIDMGVPPHWNSYITVDDVDAVAARVPELGGELVAPPFDVMEAGRMAVIRDPSGGYVFLWEPRDHIGAGLVNAPGAFSWNELNTRDPQAASDFFGELLGWRYDESESAAGTRYWTIVNGDRQNGGILEMSDQFPQGIPANWVVYMAVDDVAAAADKAAGLGSQVVMPRTEIRDTGEAIAVLHDPRVGVFALYEGQLDD
jgi:predicted enzyme related to lactoylglutathione lyase